MQNKHGGAGRRVRGETRRTIASALVAAVALAGTADRALGQSDTAVRLADFRRPGLTDRQVVAAALHSWVARGGGVIEFEPGRRYDLGEQPESGTIFAIGHLTGAVLRGNGATLVVRTTGRSVYNMLLFTNYAGLQIHDLHATDLGYRDDEYGAKFIVLEPGLKESRNVTISTVTGERLLSFLHVQGPAAPFRVTGITILAGCVATRCYYAINCQDQGDHLYGQITATDCRRAYFPYGVADHDLRIAVHRTPGTDAPPAESCLLIKSYGRPTRSIWLRAQFSGALPWEAREGGAVVPGSCVTLEHQHDPASGPSTIADIAVDLSIPDDIQAVRPVHSVTFRSIDGHGQVEARTANIWRHIMIAGTLPIERFGIAVESTPTTPTNVLLRGSFAAAVLPGGIGGFRFRRG